MSIAEFYIDNGIDPSDPHHMDRFLNAHCFDEDENSHELKVVLPKLRSKLPDLSQAFDKALMQRRDAFVHGRFSIFNPNFVEIKFVDLKQGKCASQEAKEKCVDLKSRVIQRKVQAYVDRTAGQSKVSGKRSIDECLLGNANSDDSAPPSKKTKSNSNVCADVVADADADAKDGGSDREEDQVAEFEFNTMEERDYPPSLFWSGCPLKCKWIDEEGNAHIEYFQYKDVDSIICQVINVDRMNRPSCNNWCVTYENCDDMHKHMEQRSKSFDFDLFWSCCIFYTVFGTCGCVEYDHDLQQMLANAADVQLHVEERSDSNTYYHNQHPNLEDKKESPRTYCGWRDPQDIKEEKIRSKPPDMKNPFFAEMLQRKKAMILGKFELWDRELKESKPDDENVNILQRNVIRSITKDFAANNEVLKYRMVAKEEYAFVGSSVFDLKDYGDGHRCIAVWTDDEGKQYEEWFKFYKRSSLFMCTSSLDSLHWGVSYLNGAERPYCDLNSFWAVAAYFKIFGICGIKKYDDAFYKLYQEFC
eukprot:CAMPEP_0202695912 /NCGR_PEP_ID=MMETSP1385-20130828/9349_1 /ASSEMBLY_ACC=CAM_ASM_000861 /TAXON_ID=933848 /ORGANISM="Elphidium margaritaceum" /LENGTH=530 /DNA_ID=CAMNT_0049351993 /DNA_START=1 /DNA_END=1593 /DNA_ORIENTATION=+